ncbi:hypothetical protein GCM10010517_72600 [Streptosporangium fragile]|uniref:Roadblock/LAMTOR2 domain-containing protein n=1 Tax=Streptosporangium fragile TaxID=46186 RepID=A0ABN3WA86_9ACTN
MTKEAVLAELDVLREQVPGVLEAVVASADGLLVAADSEGSRPEVLAALAATTLGLGRRAGYEVGMGGLHEVVVRCDRGYMVVYALREEGLLAVVADEGLDIPALHAGVGPTVERLADVLAEV